MSSKDSKTVISRLYFKQFPANLACIAHCSTSDAPIG